MLIQVTDKKGLPVWINALYVRSLRQKRGGTELSLGLGISLQVLEQPDAVAQAIAAAGVPGSGVIVAISEAQQSDAAAAG